MHSTQRRCWDSNSRSQLKPPYAHPTLSDIQDRAGHQIVCLVLHSGRRCGL